MTLRRMHAIMFPLLIGLGILAYSVADQHYITLVISVPVLIAARLINGGAQPTPLPRWLINVLVVLATIFLALRWGGNFDEIISVVCQYLVLLQLLKMFEPAHSRDQAQSIMLSVMLVIGSTLTSVTAELGLVLIVYLPLLLWTILLHQLLAGEERVANDESVAAQALVVGARPMRDLGRIAMLAGVLILVGAITLFVAMPRNVMGQNAMMGQWGNPASATSVTGFTSQVKLGSSGLLTESTRVVMEMELVSDDGETLLGGRRLLRGAVLDFYDRDRGEWRSNVRVRREPMRMAVNTNTSRSSVEAGEVVGEAPPRNATQFTQHITMRVPVMRNLFAMWKPQTFRLDAGSHLLINRDPFRGTYTVTVRRQNQNISYTVVSTPHALTPDRRYDLGWFDQTSESWGSFLRSLRATGNRNLPWEEVYRVVPLSMMSSRKPEIEPARAANPFTDTPVQALAERILAERRLDVDAPSRDTYDAAASAFKLYLQDNYSYTTEMIAPAPDQDPIEMFLFDEELGGRGHCEYFASAMAALCMSVGIPARVVTGYVASETDGAGRFIIRENHAHAWAEVEIRPGRWQEFDPSPPEEVQRLHTGGPGLAASLRRVFEVFQLAWIRNVVTYDRERNASEEVGERGGAMQVLRAANRWVGSQLLDQGELTEGTRTGSALSATARTFLSVLMLSTLLGTGLYLAMSRGPLALRRALAFLTLSAPPTELGSPELRALRDQQRKLNEALSSVGLGWDAYTPALQHTRAIEESHPEIACGAVRVTDLFYGVRFGQHEPSDEEIQAARQTVREIRERCAQVARHGAAPHNGSHASTNGSASR